MSRAPKLGSSMWWPDIGAASRVLSRKALGLSLETTLALSMTYFPALPGTRDF